MKRIQWLGTSLNTVRDFPENVRKLVGQELRFVQTGSMPTDFKPMTTVGAGAYEIWVRAGNQYRVIYVAKFAESVYVLHSFIKTTTKTSKPDLEMAKAQYTTLLKERKT